MDLENARREIDDIDNEITKLFVKRMGIADEIARIKMNDGITVLNTSREESILKKATESVPKEYSAYCVAFYKNLMALSRERQHGLFSSESVSKFKFEAELEGLCDEIKDPRVAVQGVPGSYSSIAAMRMYPSCKLLYFNMWEDVLRCIEDGAADYGVLPVENSSAGTVTEVYDLLFKYKHRIVKAYQLTVDHCLLGMNGASINDIKEVYTHPHAFPQCSDFLKEKGLMHKITCPNTAMAAEFVAKSGDKSKAAIASRECAEIYGLQILAQSIQQADDNRTRFISVSKRNEIHNNASKISLICALPHVTGSLYRMLSRFSLNGHNLTQIISRPNKDKPFEYFFYIDFSGSVKSPATINLLGMLNEELPFFHYFGNYDESYSNSTKEREE